MSLIISLIARTGVFDRNIKKSRRVMRTFNRDTARMRRSMIRMGRGIMVAAGITGLGYMIKQTMASIDSTAKLSDRLGVATEKLIGMQHAASITGTNAETLNKSLEIFTRRLGEMTQGSGEAKRGLDMLGLTADQLIHKSPAEAFGIAADKIKQLGTQAEKTAAAYFLFGRAGSQMLNMLEVGSEGLIEFQKEAEKLGLTFSRFDASQVEAANDALTRARAVMTGLVRQATIQLSPYIGALADKFVDVATAGEGVGANVVNAFESMSLAAIRFGGLVQTIPAYWKGVEAGARESLAAIYDLADAATNLDVLFKKLKRPGWEKTYKELAEEQRQIAAGLFEAGGSQLAGAYGQENAVKRFYEGLRSEAEKRRVTLEAAAGQRAGVSPIEDTAKAAAQIEKHTETIADHWYRASRRVQTSMGDALEGIMENVHNTKDMFKEFTVSIAKSMRMAVADMISQWIMFQAFTGVGRMVGSAMLTNIGARIGNPMAPVTVAHRGGIAGQISRKRMVPSAAFMGAPRLHEGFNLGQNEMPAIIDKRERILPPGVGMQMPAVNIVINNESGVPLQQKGNPIIARDKILIFIEAKLNDRIQRNVGPLRNTIENLK